MPELSCPLRSSTPSTAELSSPPLLQLLHSPSEAAQRGREHARPQVRQVGPHGLQ
uniref:Uncharacterized protein n=1 Tax=Arundo donax TaxID=35708 RepID=A0A0A9HFJ2_ARUDO